MRRRVAADNNNVGAADNDRDDVIVAAAAIVSDLSEDGMASPGGDVDPASPSSSSSSSGPPSLPLLRDIAAEVVRNSARWEGTGGSSKREGTEEDEDDDGYGDVTNTTTMKVTVRHHLVLHVDVNETILVGDEAGGDSNDDSMHKIIAKSAFVRVPGMTGGTAFRSSSYDDTKDIVPTHWWNGDPIVVRPDRRQQQLAAKVPPPPPLYTGWEWPRNCCPYYRTSMKRYSSNFAGDVARGPVVGGGHVYRGTLLQMKERLSFGSAAGRPMKSPSSPTPPPPSPRPRPPGVLEHMIPAFFRTLVQLTEERRAGHRFRLELPPGEAGRRDGGDEGGDAGEGGGRKNTATTAADVTAEYPWTLVFRTFGTDLNDVMDAVSYFAAGHHPDYPRYRNDDFVVTDDGSRARAQGRWKEVQENAEYRHDDGKKKRGTTKRYAYQLHGKDRARADKDDGDDDDDGPVLARGDDEALRLIHGRKIFGIRDDYRFWSRHGCEPWAGKPVWKLTEPRIARETSATTTTTTTTTVITMYHHVIFDDNIHNLTDDSIVSIREEEEEDELEAEEGGGEGEVTTTTTTTSTGGLYWTLSGDEIRREHGIHMVRVPTIEPITNEMWFVNQIRASEVRYLRGVLNRLRRRRRRQKTMNRGKEEQQQPRDKDNDEGFAASVESKL